MLFPDNARRDLARFYGDRLIDDPLLVGIVAHLHIATERKILAEWVTDKSVIREDTAQVGVTGEHDAIKIECFAFKPVGGRPYIYYRIHNRKLVILGECLYTHSAVMPDRKQVINDNEAFALTSLLRSGLYSIDGVIHSTQIDEHLETQFGMIAQGSHYRQQVSRRHCNDELVQLLIDVGKFIRQHILKAKGERFQTSGRHR